MKVSLIDYTGCGDRQNPARYAAEILIYAKSTRLTQGEELLEQIQGLDDEQIATSLTAIQMSVRSSWEFVDYTFQIEGVTRAFTHQLVRSRHLSFAQQAMRIADMSEGFDHLEPYKVKLHNRAHNLWHLTMQMIASSYKELRGYDIPPEDARGVLPTNVLTNIMTKCNLRSLAELVGKRDNARAQGEYVDVIREMERLVIGVHPWTEEFLHPPRLKTPALDDILAQMLDGRPPAEVPNVNLALKELDRLKGVWG